MTVAARRAVGIVLTLGLLVAAVTVVTAPAVGASGSTEATAAAVKPYPGFEKAYRSSFPSRRRSPARPTRSVPEPSRAGKRDDDDVLQGPRRRRQSALGMKYIGLDDGLSIDKQVSNFNQLLARGANAIALYPLAPNALRASLAKAKQQGVAVIGFNVTFTKSARRRATTCRSGRAVTPRRTSSVAEMARSPGRQGRDRRDSAPGARDQDLAQRYRSGRRSSVQVVGQEDDPTDDIPGGRQAMSGLLGKYSDIDGVLAYNDESAVGSYTAARSAGRNDIEIIGINGSSLGISALEAGHVAAIVQVDAVNQGAQAAAGAYNVLTKQGAGLPSVVVMRPKLLTKDTSARDVVADQLARGSRREPDAVDRAEAAGLAWIGVGRHSGARSIATCACRRYR